MKKSYIAPAANVLHVQTVQVLADSMKYGGSSNITDEASVLSDRLGWNSDDWASVEEE